MITILGCIVFWISVDERFMTAKYHKLKGILFISFGTIASLPILHLRFGTIKGNEVSYDFFLFYLAVISYGVGGLLYTFKFPERVWPGKFCIFGNSHQIFHCLVLLGVLSTYLFCINIYSYRKNYQCALK